MPILAVHLELSISHLVKQCKPELMRTGERGLELICHPRLSLGKFTEFIKDNYCVIRTAEALLTVSFKLPELASCPSPSDQCVNTLVAGRDSFKGRGERSSHRTECATQISEAAPESKQYYPVLVFLIARQENNK